MASQQRRQLTPAERTELAVKQTTRMLSANVNSAYTQPSSSFMKRPSETWAEYTPKYTPVDKSRHLQKDDIKTCVRRGTRLHLFLPTISHSRLPCASLRYVEKALSLHDERQGMPVVASPIWAPKSSSRKG